MPAANHSIPFSNDIVVKLKMVLHRHGLVISEHCKRKNLLHKSMMVKMMRWSPWSPFFSSEKFEAVIVVHRIEGLNNLSQSDDDDKDVDREKNKRKLAVEIKWKGQRTSALSPVLKNLTAEGGFCGDGIVEWNEEFKNFCKFSRYMDGCIHPWEIQFTVFNDLSEGPTNILGTSLVNLGEYACLAEENELGIKLPLVILNGTTQNTPSLCLSIKLIKVRANQESSNAKHRSIVPVATSPSSEKSLPIEKTHFFSVKSGLRKANIFKNCVSARRTQNGYYNDQESSSKLEYAEVESDENEESVNARNLFNYETLAHANCVAGLGYTSGHIIGREDNCLMFCRSGVRSLPIDNCRAIFEQQSLKSKILYWKKRALSFKSPKTKEEPLLKKDYREEGGDDIDFDRRQLSSSDDSSFGWCKSEGCATGRSSFSEFGDDCFSVGSWEEKSVISRDGLLKLDARVFFASIDQRSERAAGESACTALVAVITNWLHSNRHEMPARSEFDSLIRKGSLEWRNLCNNEDYILHFPDKHFDLETIIQAKIHPLSVIPEKSFIGFFHTEGLEGGEGLDFLSSAMSFDSIWDEIVGHGSEQSTDVEPLIYIISWNDHFFVLKVDHDAYYIIDTLGERLYEGCNQAYILKFDKDTKIRRTSNKTKPMENCSNEESSKVCEDEIVCIGKESCKEYIKSFLAAIPIRELEADIKKGLMAMASTPLHQRLQIEFHYTQMFSL